VAATKEIRKRAKRPPRTPTVRLRKADTGGPGIRRKRAGRGFFYVDAEGTKVAGDDVLARIHDLAIPPAWEDVWICPYPGGHIQATGVDQKGRKQYLYHRKWRERRDQEKFDEMLRFARQLPMVRERVSRDLADNAGADDMSRDRVLAAAVRLLDRGFFRIGSEDYAVENESYGLATMRKEHVTLRDGSILFDYPAKSGKRRVQSVVDEEVASVVARLKRRRGGIDELLAYREGRRWRDVKSADINLYVKEVTGEDFSAKDFRTWGATVLAAVALAVSPARDTKTARNRAVVRAIKEVARHLGNTPAVARASYVDPRVIDRYLDGISISPALGELAADPQDTAIQGDLEAAVLDLIEGHETAYVGAPEDVLADVA
jgi:DNA topoisomerase IB